VLFKPLSQAVVSSIVTLFLAELIQRLAEQHVHLDISDAVAGWLGKHGYDPMFGARPLKRFIQDQLETPIARLLIAGEAGKSIHIHIKDDSLLVQ